MKYKLAVTVEQAEKDLENAVRQYCSIYYQHYFNELWDDKINATVMQIANSRYNVTSKIVEDTLQKIATEEAEADEWK